MGISAIIVISIWAVICLRFLSAFEKSHNLWLTRVVKPITNDSWIQVGKIEMKKIPGHKSARSACVNFTTYRDLDSDDIMCEVNFFQKDNGNKYFKAPTNYPKGPCCSFMKNYKKLWGCIQKNSNLPEECPIRKGSYSLRDLNPDECNPVEFIPPGLPEFYKGQVTITKNNAPLLKMEGFGIIKKRF